MYIIRSETYLQFNHLINAPVCCEEGQLLVKKAEFETDLWLEGKSAGNVTAEIIMKHTPYLRQKITGVLTESGPQRSAPIIVGKNSNPKLKELSEKLDIFREILYNKDNSSNKEVHETCAYQLQQLAKSILLILKVVDMTSTNSFIYKSEEDMIQAQELFMQIATNLYLAADKLETSLQQDYYECMRVLLRRGELDLSALSFDSASTKRNLQTKQKIALQYQTLLYKLLSDVFDYLDQQGLNGIHTDFIEFYLAYAYFRIPEFRVRLLDLLSIEKSTIYTDKGKIIEIDSVLMDWDKGFYSYIKDQPKNHDNREILTKAWQKNWKKKFMHQGHLFFYFVIEWCDYVRATLVIKNIAWDNIIGYDTIVDNFIERMHAKEVVAYPDILINASLSLICNPNVLDLMVKTLITNTK